MTKHISTEYFDIILFLVLYFFGYLRRFHEMIFFKCVIIIFQLSKKGKQDEYYFEKMVESEPEI